MTAARVVLLFGNTAEHNSRAERMAGSLAGAGYEVTLVARAAPDLRTREERGGYRTVRVPMPAGPRWLPAPGLPDLAAAAPGRAGPVGALRRAVREGPGRLLQALRYVWLSGDWASAVERVAPAADIWQADGLVMLPVALRLRARHGGAVVYDSLEIHVESGRFARLPRAWKWLLGRRERTWAMSADAVLTVSGPYAEVLSRRLGVRPAVVMNCPPAPHDPASALAPTPQPAAAQSFTAASALAPTPRPAAASPFAATPPLAPAPQPGEASVTTNGGPRPRRFHELLGLPPEVPVVLYHGYLFPHRGIERLFEASGLLPKAHLVLMGFGPRFDAYRTQAAALPHAARVHVVPGVPPAELLDWVASADVAAMPIEGDTLNHRLTTPNKLFEALSAGVPLVASELPGMAAIVRETGAGLTCDPDDPADIARAISSILDATADERAGYRERALAAARSSYNWERQAETYLGVMSSLVAR